MTSIAGQFEALVKAPFCQLHHGIRHLLEKESIVFAKYCLLPEVTKLVPLQFHVNHYYRLLTTKWSIVHFPLPVMVSLFPNICKIRSLKVECAIIVDQGRE